MTRGYDFRGQWSSNSDTLRNLITWHAANQKCSAVLLCSALPIQYTHFLVTSGAKVSRNTTSLLVNTALFIPGRHGSIKTFCKSTLRKEWSEIGLFLSSVYNWRILSASCLCSTCFWHKSQDSALSQQVESLAWITQNSHSSTPNLAKLIFIFWHMCKTLVVLSWNPQTLISKLFQEANNADEGRVPACSGTAEGCMSWCGQLWRSHQHSWVACASPVSMVVGTTDLDHTPASNRLQLYYYYYY